MNSQTEPSTDTAGTSFLIRCGFALLILIFWGWFTATAKGQNQSQLDTSVAQSPIHVTHVLGFEGVRRNASGELSISDDDLRFQRNGRSLAQVSITSIQNISLGEEDKQEGGVPMMLGKTAVPFGGGRVVSLFSHKKYDSLAIEYLDSNGGFHGAIFRLAKGRGETVRSDLIAHGAQVTPSEDPRPIRTTPEKPLKATEEWSVQVARIDPGATTLDPSFSDALYENILRELLTSKRFKDVFRSGDSNTNDVSAVLVLKTLAERYSPGSETRRAVTTIAGTTKLKVRIQLLTRGGTVVLERSVEGDVRFIGDNLGATNKVAHNAAKILKRSTLPEPATPIAQRSTWKGAYSVTMSFEGGLREESRSAQALTWQSSPLESCSFAAIPATLWERSNYLERPTER